LLDPLNMEVPATAEAAQHVRAVLRSRLGDALDERELGDAELVVTELMTNSVRHSGVPAGDPLHVRVSAEDHVLHLEVEDRGRNGEVRRRVPHPGGGMGLNLVDQLALEWGVRRDAHTTVWVELPFTTPPPA
jgi:anti-sigma regulatory factor (Ser/Thr protein kinase)